MKKQIKILFAIVLIALAVLQNPISVMAITTQFMVPDIDPNDTSRTNVLYMSPNLNVQVCKFSYGLVGDVLNTTGNLDALITELNTNSSASSYSNSIVGIYMEGAALSDSNASALAAAGWKKLEMYYEKFLISGEVPSCGMKPVIEIVDDATVVSALTSSGFSGQAGVFRVSGVTMTEPGVILYAPEFNFLRGGNVQIYKYVPAVQKFVAGPTAMYDGYDRSFMDMEGVHLADGDPNGTYVAVTSALPADMLITSEEAQNYRGQNSNENEAEGEEVGLTETESEVETIVTSEDENVVWTFAEGETPENFTAEAKVESLSEEEVKVDFAFSGELPEGTQVTIALPENKYDEDKVLYFYYYNPETDTREFVSEGVVKAGKVTFDINHCSEYIITTEKTEVVMDAVEKQPDVLPIIGVVVVVFCVVVIVLVGMKRKK